MIAATPKKKSNAPKVIAIVAVVVVALFVVIALVPEGSSDSSTNSGSNTSNGSSTSTASSPYDGYWMTVVNGNSYIQIATDGTDIRAWVCPDSDGKEQELTGTLSVRDGSFSFSDNEAGSFSNDGDDLIMTLSGQNATTLSKASVYVYQGDTLNFDIWVAGKDVVLTFNPKNGDDSHDIGTITSDGTISYTNGQTGKITSDGDNLTYSDSYGNKNLPLKRVA